jgi:hypothetical protein
MFNAQMFLTFDAQTDVIELRVRVDTYTLHIHIMYIDIDIKHTLDLGG